MGWINSRFFLRALRNIVSVTLPAVLVLLVMLELFFRFVIPASYQPGIFFDEQEKMISLSRTREKGQITIGKFAEIRTRFRINNLGWNYPIDYHPLNDRPLIAVIGDSYVEALQVDVDKNYPFLLRDLLKNDYEVYAFGISGAPLSQYLHISRYVNRHFNPRILIFNLIHNDFDESIKELDPAKDSFLQLSFNKESSMTETIPQPSYATQQYRPWKRIFYKSAVIRYIWLNLRINEAWNRLKSPEDEDTYESNLRASDVNQNKELILRATDYLIKTIREENSGKRIIFVFDAPRLNIYNQTLNKSGVRWINDMVETICFKNGVEYVDLTPLMQRDYGINKKRFNSEVDFHWNEYGHQFVAKVMSEYLSRK